MEITEIGKHGNYVSVDTLEGVLLIIFQMSFSGAFTKSILLYSDLVWVATVGNNFLAIVTVIFGSTFI